jgi:hypothetical protein
VLIFKLTHYPREGVGAPDVNRVTGLSKERVVLLEESGRDGHPGISFPRTSARPVDVSAGAWAADVRP